MIKVLNNEYIKRASEKETVKTAITAKATSHLFVLWKCWSPGGSIWSKLKQKRREPRRMDSGKRVNYAELNYHYYDGDDDDTPLAFVVSMKCGVKFAKEYNRGLWAVNSGATHHICNDNSKSAEMKEDDHGDLVFANGNRTNILGLGTADGKKSFRTGISANFELPTCSTCRV